MPKNKFTASLKTLEDNTNIDNQGTNTAESSVLPLEMRSEVPPEVVSEQQEVLSEVEPETGAETLVSETPVSAPTTSKTKKKKSASPITVDVEGVIGQLSQKGMKGQTVSVYLKNELAKELDKIASEKNLNKSRIISAILEQTLLPK